MLTEINGNLYLNDQSMTILMADMVRDYVQRQQQEDVEDLTQPELVFLDAPSIVGGFKSDWGRPNDESNENLQSMYESVPDAINWAAQRELDRRAAADYQKRVDNLINSIVNPEEYPDDDDWDAIHNDEDLF
jgi:hypothetical protein